MKTVFSTGPGLFSIVSHKGDSTIPEGNVRVYCARLDCYELLASEAELDNHVSFMILPALAERDKRFARVLLRLKETLDANVELLKRLAEE